MNLAVAFANCVQKNPGKTAIYWGEKEISYPDLLAQAQCVAAHLKKQFGVKPGDRVAIWLKNCPEFSVSVFGILLAEAVVVPVNNFLKPAEIGYILNDGAIDVVITDAELAPGEKEVQAARSSVKFLPVET